MYQLLKGLRVVECASFIAAPSCALHMQQMGAEVIRIDPIGGGPDFRRWPQSKEGDSFYWEGLNKGKKSVALDLSRPEGRELAASLITAPGEQGGLFITNFPQRGFLSHDALRDRRSDLITVRVAGWNDGEAAVDYTINASLGVPFMTGSADNGANPVNHVLPAWDLLTGAYAAFAALAAERYRRDTGQGQEVLLPLSDVALASMGHMGQLAEVMISGDRPRAGNAIYGSFGRDFATADGQRVMIVAITPRQWTGLVESLGIKTAIDELEARLCVSFLREEGQRYLHCDALFALVEAVVGERSVEQLGASFGAHGVCWSVYHTLDDALRNEPRLSPSGPMFTTLRHPSGYTYAAPGAAATLPGQTRQPVTRAPRLGEHTEQVLSELLSMSSTQIQDLRRTGLIADAAH